MMGRQDRDQGQLFYEFNLDEVIPKGHLLRRMNVFVTGVLTDLHQQLRLRPQLQPPEHLPYPATQSSGSGDPNRSFAMTMAKAPTIDTIAAELSVLERVLLFCLASHTDWVKAAVTHSTVQHMLIRNLVARDHTTQLVLTERGHAVLAALLKPSKK